MAFMLDEIREQPQIITTVIEKQWDAVTSLAAEIRRRNIAFVYIAARGTSDHAAVYGKYVLEIHNGLPVALAAPSVFTQYESGPHLGPQTLVIGVSQSGAGPDVIEVLRRARKSGALTVAVVNDLSSKLASESEYTLGISAGIERSVAATKTYSGSLALFALLSVALNENDRQRANELSQVSMHMTLALELNDSARAIAETYKDVSECVTLARGYNQATAQETALKLIETSYIGARAYSAADFQHGPVAQLENGLPCLLFAPEGRTFASMLQFTEKLHAKHTNLICIGHDQSFLNLGRASLAISEIVPEWLSPLVYIIPAQLLAYHLAVARGSNPDAPRSLNKVTQTT